MTEYPSLVLSIDDDVATIQMKPLSHSLELENPPGEIHEEMGDALTRLRARRSLRAVVLTGTQDGEFLVPPPQEHYLAGHSTQRLTDAAKSFARYRGISESLFGIAQLDCPVIAKVNGDAMSFGQSLMFCSDIIVAREDAIVSDLHLSSGQMQRSDGVIVGPPFDMVPGDGGLALVPLFMPPALAKEYLLLGSQFRADELAARGLINRAVRLEELDGVIDEYLEKIKRRPIDAVAWAKRIANRELIQQLNVALDAGIGFQLLKFSHDLSAASESPL